MNKFVFIFFSLLLSGTLNVSYAQQASGSPGIIPNWSVAKKVQVGTSKSDSSLVWFTNAQGILTETYFPTIDRAQIKDAQILVSDSKSFFVEERTQTRHEVKVLSPSMVKLVNKDHFNRFSIEHVYYTLNDQSVLVDEITVDSKIDNLSFYLLVNSALNNTGFNDNAFALKDKLKFQEDKYQLNVYSTIGVDQTSVGYVGFTDGWQDLRDNFKMDYPYSEAVGGNVAGMARLKVPSKAGRYTFYIVYDFESKRQADKKDLSAQLLAKAKLAYEAKWNQYLKSIKVPSEINLQSRQLYLRSMYTLKVHEDKLTKGALIASLSKPWGDKSFETPGSFNGGYHLIWPRDLYHVCTALIQAKDYTTPLNALRFLKKIQYQSGEWNYGERKIFKKGAFPQNTWTDGKEYWSGFQLDQTAYPVHIFYQLYTRMDKVGKEKMIQEFAPMLKMALDFIQRYGPWSAQERWEENYGISPSSFAAATSALKLGARIFNNQSYAQTAQGWLTKPNDNIHSWTFTHNGHYDDGQYYIRVGGCENYLASWNPDNRAYCHIANTNNLKVEQTKIVDQGFLKLSLLGLVRADDWRIKKSLNVVNQQVRVKTPNGYGWYRYSFDAYGEEQKGRLWPLLSSEHGRYAIERFRVGDLTWSEARLKVDEILESYHGFANAGNMLPEQVWEHSGEGTGAATPLAWSHAEFIKLLWSKNLKRNVENLLD